MSRSHGELARILAIIGAVIIVVEGVLHILNMGLVGPSDGFLNLGSLLNGIIAVVVGVLVLIAAGVIKTKTQVAFNGIVLLILGILGLVFGSLIGGLLVIIAAILMWV